MRTLPIGVAFCLAPLCACSEWPRSSNLPDGDPGIVAPDDPAELVEVDWETLSAIADAPVPNAVSRTLSPGMGVLIDASLDGTGWNDNLPNRVFMSNGESCDAAGSLTVGIPGDWTGDVDAFGLVIDEPVILCASVRGAGAETGWDLLLIGVDDCLLPTRTVFDADTPVGLGIGGDPNGWSLAVPPGTYQVLFAAYDPVDDDNLIDYRLALSALDVSEGDPLCPVVPPREQP